jgi:pimeloyl-ACP methyl ester carboxylesterase
VSIQDDYSISMPQVDGVSHRSVTAAGIRFHIAEAGEGDPALALHGWPQNWYCWREVIAPLASERRLICLDLRGFGWSDAPPGRYEKQTFADDVLALMDALELEQVDLLAHDWGAWAGFQVCLQHPQRVRRYLALNMPTPWPQPPSLQGALGLPRLWYQVALATPGVGQLLLERTDFVAKLLRGGAAKREAFSAADLEVFQSVLREPARVHASTQLYRTFLTRELVPYLAGNYGRERLSVPTLLLHGTRDPAIDYRQLGRWQENADEMAVELRHDSGHFIAEELPEFVTDRAKALFGGASPRDIVANSPATDVPSRNARSS